MKSLAERVVAKPFIMLTSNPFRAKRAPLLKKGLFSFADFWFTEAQKGGHSVLELPCFKTSGVAFWQLAKISVDLLFCNANSNFNLIATGYRSSTPWGASAGNCGTYRPAGCQMLLDVLTLVLMTSCSEDDFVQLGLSLLSLTV